MKGPKTTPPEKKAASATQNLYEQFRWKAFARIPKASASYVEITVVVYWDQGSYLPDALSHISYVLRDHRTDEVHSIDPMTLDLLAAISRKVDARHSFEIISGYRSPLTNKLLRSKSRSVAKNSYHMQGKAVDLRLPGVPLKVVRKAALDLRMGCVGYYPKSDFVHIDSGRVRSW